MFVKLNKFFSDDLLSRFNLEPLCLIDSVKGGSDRSTCTFHDVSVHVTAGAANHSLPP